MTIYLSIYMSTITNPIYLSIYLTPFVHRNPTVNPFVNIRVSKLDSNTNCKHKNQDAPMLSQPCVTELPKVPASVFDASSPVGKIVKRVLCAEATQYLLWHLVETLEKMKPCSKEENHVDKCYYAKCTIEKKEEVLGYTTDWL